MRSRTFQLVTSFRTVLLALALLLAGFLVFPANAFSQGPDNVLYSFQAANDGAGPNGELVVDSKGNLYGTTAGGGSDFGTAFELSPPTVPGGAWTENIIYNFSLDSGINPFAGLTMDAAGNLYGVTWLGGPGGGGDVFELSPPSQQGGTWTATILYDFSAPNDGYSPLASVTFDQEGNLYGTTSVGGKNPNPCMGGCGTVFRLAPPKSGSGPWTETVLYNFPGTTGEDGYGGTYSGVAVGLDGSVYCTSGSDPTKAKGKLGNVFRLTPKHNKRGTYEFTTLYKFAGGVDGSGPNGTPIFDQQGNLYGTTYGGGTGGSGTVFQLTNNGTPQGPWTETVLYSFTGGTDGANPSGKLLMDGNGNLYGTTASGGDFSCYSTGCGTVFKLSPPSRPGDSWTETTLHAFSGGSDGEYPSGGVIFGLSQILYGVTGLGGSAGCGGLGCGTVYSLNP